MEKKAINKIYGIAIITVMFVMAACSKTDSYNVPSSTDTTKPDPPSNIQVKNFSGGAHIIYDLPKTKNILYVLADYVINDSTGVKRQTKTSYYNDTTTVEGFALAKPYTVTLKTVSRANVESDPVTVTVNPETPAYLKVANSMEMWATFGGVNITAENPNGQGVTVVYLYDDPAFKRYVIREQKYFDALNINYSLRGFDTEPKKFGAYVIDRWGNKSEVLYATISPLFEMLLDKSKFKAYPLPSDIPTQLGYPITNMWDDNATTFWHYAYSNPAPTAAYPKPYVISFGLGQRSRLSRFVFHQRQFSYWGDGSVETFSLWGSSNDAPRDAVLPVSAEEGTVIGDWINLGNFDFPLPPSGSLSSSPTEADIAWWNDGVDFEMVAGTPQVQFLRFVCSKTWGGREGDYIAELTFYGGN